MNWKDEICQFCWHDDDLHEFGPSQRTPKEHGSGYVCSDCVVCEKETVNAS